MDTVTHTAKIVVAYTGPSLPLLHDTGNEWPTYTGPLWSAQRLAVVDRWLHQFPRNGKFNCFLSADPDGEDCQEWGMSYESAEQALRDCLGVYFARLDHTEESLRQALRSVLDDELNQLGD